MKTIVLIALGCSLGLQSFAHPLRPAAATQQPADTKPAITWNKQQLSIGEVPQGKPVAFEFQFVNTGKEPVLITEVKAGCGCTTTDYTRSPIKPGEKGTIKAVYNAAAVGPFTKSVTVTTSADPNPVMLSLSGTVLAAPAP